jgi:hypothetical protein
MNQLLRVSSGALSWLIKHEGVAITVAGETHRAYQGNVNNVKDLAEGGFVPNNVVEFHIIKADWTTLPVIGATVTCGSTIYRINSTGTSDNDPCMVLGCIGDDR